MEHTQTNERLNPSYYKFPNGVEVGDIARYLTFNCGNAVKYAARAGSKVEEGVSDKDKQIEDLLKAVEYLLDEVNRIKGNPKVQPPMSPEDVRRYNELAQSTYGTSEEQIAFLDGINTLYNEAR